MGSGWRLISVTAKWAGATELIVVDDELKPDLAAERARKLVESDKAEFVVGPIFSNVLGAIFKPVTSSGAVLISPNAGSSAFAGKGCSSDFFVTSYENNQVHAVLGKYAQDKGYKRAFLMTPNYQAGKDSVTGFRSMFKGEVLEEDFVPLTQVDFQADLARIAAAKPGCDLRVHAGWAWCGTGETVPAIRLSRQYSIPVGVYGG
jgi:branched-chain amino acid transport system substrate-binding protein